MEEAGPVRKRRKGGLHQRAAAHQQAIGVDSALKELLMRYFAQGLLSAAIIHKIVQAACKDVEQASEGLMVNGLDEIATLTHGKNLHRSMMAKLAKDATVPEPFEVNIPLQSVPAGKASSKVLLPHEQFVHMYNSKEGWDASILPDPAGLPSFWEHFSKHPCMKNHPILSKENYEEKAIPLALRGDEVPVMRVGKIWCHSSLALSWNSLMATAAGRSAEDTMIYIWGCFEKFIIPTADGFLGTIDTFFQLMKWSFSILLEGKWPARDWQGKKYPRGTPEARKAGSKLCDGYCGVLVQLAGDLDYLAKWLEVPRWSGHAKPCGLCRATYKGPCSWLDNRVNSRWQGSMLTTANWRSHFNPANPLYQLPGMSALSIGLDFMHNHYLGWIQYFYGSVIILIVEDLLDGQLLENLQYVNQFIKNHQKTNETRGKFKPRWAWAAQKLLGF